MLKHTTCRFHCLCYIVRKLVGDVDGFGSKGGVPEYDEGKQSRLGEQPSVWLGAVLQGLSNEVCKLNEVAEFYSDHKILYTKNVVDSVYIHFRGY